MAVATVSSHGLILRTSDDDGASYGAPRHRDPQTASAAHRDLLVRHPRCCRDVDPCAPLRQRRAANLLTRIPELRVWGNPVAIIPNLVVLLFHVHSLSLDL